MSRYYSYINTCKDFVQSYTGAEPFGSFIKKKFASDKKFGSRDRKIIAHLCYTYFRSGKSLSHLTFEDRLAASLFLVSDSLNEILQLLKPEWNTKTAIGLEEKLKQVDSSFNSREVFDFNEDLSDEVEPIAFSLSHFVQPDLFLRIRPGMKEEVLSKLLQANLSFQLIGDDSIALPNTTKIHDVLQVNKEVVVQDYSSQQVASFFGTVKSTIRKQKLKVWDCCAASGGKSILLYDLIPDIELTVSDIRDSILINLQNRFEEAGIKKYNSLVLDLSVEQLRNSANQFQLIIADVPCSGSGTWGRTPEHLSFFKKESINEYASLQKKITGNCLPSLKPEGYLLYITCSVFKKENEEVVNYLQDEYALQLTEQKLIKGYNQKADTMFAALLKKN